MLRTQKMDKATLQKVQEESPLVPLHIIVMKKLNYRCLLYLLRVFAFGQGQP